jgi:hypothetical protein
MQAELHSAVRNCTKIVFLVIRRQDDRDNTACLKIDCRSQFTSISAEVKHYLHSCFADFRLVSQLPLSDLNRTLRSLHPVGE